MNEFDGAWITTYTGLKFHFLDLTSDEICIEDIAHALSLKCRYNGHCRTFYSVAQHSLLVATLAPGYRLEALLHDAAEAYLPDIPRPIKYQFPALKQLEDKILSVILRKFGIYTISPIVKEADNIALATEARILMANTDDWADLPEPLDMPIKPMLHAYIELLYLDAFKLAVHGLEIIHEAKE